MDKKEKKKERENGEEKVGEKEERNAKFIEANEEVNSKWKGINRRRDVERKIKGERGEQSER